MPPVTSQSSKNIFESTVVSRGIDMNSRFDFNPPDFQILKVKQNILEDETSLIINTGYADEQIMTEIVKGKKSNHTW